jgi:O-antigen ligase
MDREQLDNFFERAILGLVLAILVFAPLATGAVGPVSFLVVQGLTVVILGVWMARFWIRPGYRLLWPPINWAVLAFAGYAVVRYFQAPAEFIAREELIRVLIYTFLFFAVLDNLNRQETAQWIIFALIFLAMAISMYAVYQFLAGSDRVWHYYKPVNYIGRGSGTYISPNHLAGFLELILPLGLAYTLMGRLNHTLKVFLGYASLAIIAGIGVTLSRGGWVAAGISLFVFFGMLLWRRETRLPALIVCVLLLAAGGFFIKETLQSKKRFQSAVVDGEVRDVRFKLWKPAAQIWKDHFWWGGGPGHFDALFREYRPKDIQLRPYRAHNDYLNTLADWGLTGALLVAAAWGFLYLGVFKTWKFVGRNTGLTSKPSNRSAFVLGASAGLLAILIHSLFDFNFHIPANALVVVVLMALLTGHLRFATEKNWVDPGWAGRILATALALAGLIYLGTQTLLRAQEQRWLQTASKHENFSLEQLAALKRAHAADPKNPETVYRIGEILRLKSWSALQGYRPLAEEAMEWYVLGMKLNPLDPYPPLRYGMCLHLLERHEEAGPYFEKTDQLDPNSYYIAAHLGWHHFQLENYQEAKKWFERSMDLSLWRLEKFQEGPDWHPNPSAHIYLHLIQEILGETAFH